MKIQVSEQILMMIVFAASSCISPGALRTEQDLEVGQASVDDMAVTVQDGLAAIRELSATKTLLWAQAPVLNVTITSESMRQLEFEVRNCMPDAVLTQDSIVQPRLLSQRVVWCSYSLTIEPGTTELRLAPPDADQPTAYQFADMGDIQRAMDSVDEIFEVISATPNLRFVMNTGDTTQDAQSEEYELFEEQLASLNIPIFATIGNHELRVEPTEWHERYGRFSINFTFKDVAFSYIDSGNASIDPLLREQLQAWLDDATGRVHVFGTHYPFVDPVGGRSGDFRSRTEAFEVISALSQGNVDLALFGHIHSYYEYSHANFPAYISGGGGALPEKLDNVGRHFLVITVDPAASEVMDVTRIDVD